MVNEIMSSVYKAKTNVCSAFLEGYDDYLDLNFDGTQNAISILGNIYLSGKINN